MNDLSTRQWKLDTPSAFGNAGAVLWKGNVWVRQMEYVRYAAQASNAVIKDQTGRIVWSPTGAADLSPVRLNDIGWVNGFVLDSLTDGIIEVYIK